MISREKGHFVKAHKKFKILRYNMGSFNLKMCHI